MKKLHGLFLICTALAIWAPLAASLDAQSQSIVISEFRTRGPRGINDEFIELHNASTVAVDVSNWRIRASNSANSIADRRLIPSGTIINPGCYYLVINTGSGGYSGAAGGDLTYTTELFDDGGIAITLNNGVAVDQVGMSTGSGYKEGIPLSPLLGDLDRSYERKPGTSTGYADTNDNAADFQIISPSTPRNASSPCLGSTSPTLSAAVSPNPVVQQDPLLLVATVTPGTRPASTELDVTADLSPLGWSSNQPLYDDGTNGDAVAGDGIYSYQLASVSAAPGSYTLPFLVTDEHSRTGTASIDVVVEPVPVVYLPHDVQGPGVTSPLVSQMVAVDGVVTARTASGFFMQTAPGFVDGDPASSEALFVFTSSAPAAEAAVGTLVRVNGVVSEFSADGGSATRTQLTQPSVTVLGESSVPAAETLAPTDLTPDGGPDQLERFEGMRVSIESMTAVSGTSSDGVFYAVLTGTPRPMREPGLEPRAAGFASQCALGTSCNIPLFDGNPERLRIDTGALGGSMVDVTTGVVVSGATGVLDSGSRTWSLLPELGVASPNASPMAVVAPAANHFTVASLNLQQPFDLSKASLAVRTYMQMPDVVALPGVEISMIQELATRINMDAAMSNEYSAHAGFLVRSRVQGASVSEELSGDAFTQLPLVLRATVDGPANVFDAPIIVVNARLEDMAGVDDDTSDAVRVRRQQQAELLASLLDALQEEGAVVVVGDFNAFEFNDGLVDVVGTLRGSPAPSDQVVKASPDLVEPDYAVATSGGYSFVFEGNAQGLDHVLLSGAATQRFAGLQYARINADFPEAFGADATRVERVSADDPIVAYFTFPPDEVPPVIANVTPSTTELWPANQRMVSVTFAVDASDNLGLAQCLVTSVSSNEAPAPDTTDWTIDGPLTVSLRAKRDPRGSGRTYSVTVSCWDLAGHASSAVAHVAVPDNLRNSNFGERKR